MRNEGISVCVCTYRRPALLKALLEALCAQETEGLFTYSIVVVDNDGAESAREVVHAAAAGAAVPINYYVEPRQNIALARNLAVANARDGLIAFIDDDEIPPRRWLWSLYRALIRYEVDGVLGPVQPRFEGGAPRWVIESGLYERPRLCTGQHLNWQACRTGNVLLKRRLIEGAAPPFRPECLSGEDQDFFRRMIVGGRVFVWCEEAAVEETVPPVRWRRWFLMRRALQRGFFSVRNNEAVAGLVARSLLAAPLHALAMVVVLPFMQAGFVRHLFKCSYHVGRLLGAVGVNPIRQPYVTK